MKTFFIMENSNPENDEDYAAFHSPIESTISPNQLIEFDISTGSSSPIISDSDKEDFEMVAAACQKEETHMWLVDKSYMTISEQGVMQICSLKPVKNVDKKPN